MWRSVVIVRPVVFYTSHGHHKDIDALKKGLSRYGMKDSVLDFPLAFAERRGIDTTKASTLLPKSLATRLSQLKEKLSIVINCIDASE